MILELQFILHPMSVSEKNIFLPLLQLNQHKRRCPCCYTRQTFVSLWRWEWEHAAVDPEHVCHAYTDPPPLKSIKISCPSWLYKDALLHKSRLWLTWRRLNGLYLFWFTTAPLLKKCKAFYNVFLASWLTTVHLWNYFLYAMCDLCVCVCVLWPQRQVSGEVQMQPQTGPVNHIAMTMATLGLGMSCYSARQMAERVHLKEAAAWDAVP